MKTHLRCPTRHGSKEWIIEMSREGLLILYGRTGDSPRMTTIFAKDCRPSVREEYDKRIRAKLAKGYVRVDPPISSAPPPAPKPVIDENISSWLNDQAGQGWF